MSQITTHILDTAIGKPAANVPVQLEQNIDAESGPKWAELGSGVTDENGRIGNLLDNSTGLTAGDYRLRFDSKAYFNSQSQQGFYPYVEIVFSINESQRDEHFHIPLLISPFGYSTYRGS